MYFLFLLIYVIIKFQTRIFLHHKLMKSKLLCLSNRQTSFSCENEINWRILNEKRKLNLLSFYFYCNCTVEYKCTQLNMIRRTNSWVVYWTNGHTLKQIASCSVTDKYTRCRIDEYMMIVLLCHYTDDPPHCTIVIRTSRLERNYIHTSTRSVTNCDYTYSHSLIK